jgi:N-acetylmuramic acid 6-phosphate etherase
VAGGLDALSRAIEGAEDDAEAGAVELQQRGLCSADAVIGITASGHTPFVLGCLKAAREVGARRIGITSNRNSLLAGAVEIAITPQTGAEVIAGSTRMKAGLAQKMVLHLLSTTVMVRLGYVEGNLMTHLLPTSQKLRDRAVGIVVAKTSLDNEQALRALKKCGGSVAKVLAGLKQRSAG